MRKRALLAITMLLGACAGPLPEPRADMAWVDLSAQPGDLFMADRLDGVETPDGRYYLVGPGAHVLDARYEYEIGSISPDDFGDRGMMRCDMRIRYADFRPGERYRFVARSLGFQAQGWLLDSAGREVAEAEPRHCW